MKFRRRVRIEPRWLAALLALGAAACGGRPARPPDIVLVSIDTLRADHLGCYGSTVPTSPNIDRFRRESVLFREVIAPSPSTLSSHASMFTSQLPPHHGASFAAFRPLPESALTLAEVLAKDGYRTLAVIARGQLNQRLGIGQGFEVLHFRPERGRRGAFDRSVRMALELLDRPDPRPSFLFLHTYEVHHPYTPDPQVLERLDPGYTGALGARIKVATLKEINRGARAIDAADARRIERAYDAEIVSMDAGFATLIEGLRVRRPERKTVVVLTSDHGEEFGEHGQMGWHSHTLYDELLRVPLVVRLPGGEAAGGEVTRPVRTIDIAPTLLELAGVAAPPSFDGESLLPLVRGEARRERPAIAVLDDGKPWREGSLALRWNGWKLYDRRLFDLGADPVELVDRAPQQRERALELERMLRAALERRSAADSEPVELGDELERELRALGYLQ